jgi:heptosyltransferase-3
MTADSPRILVIRRRYLGDIVLLGSLFRNLRLHWPAAEIVALVEEPYTEILGLNRDVTRTLGLPRGNYPRRWLGLLRQLRAGGFTHVFDLDNTEKTAALTRWTGASLRAKLKVGAIPEKFPFCYTKSMFVEGQDYITHPITETYLRILAAADVPIVTRDIALSPRESDLAFAETLLASPRSQPGRSRLLIHPGSRSAFRVWPAERFAALADRATRDLGTHAILVGGPGEAKLLEEIRTHAREPLTTITEKLSTPQFAALASRCAALLCHDSGPMHVAAAVGTRVIALFGSQDAAIWRPHGEGHVVLRPPLPCVNCVAPDVCVPGDSYRNYCVRNLTIETVWAAVRAQLAG